MDIIFSKHFTQKLFYMFFFFLESVYITKLIQFKAFLSKRKKEFYSDVYFRKILYTSLSVSSWWG